jgi:signal transduction histidine kinase
LAAAIRLARHLLHAERASLMLSHGGSGVLIVAAASGLPEKVIAQARVRLGDPVAGLVAQTHQPMLGNESAETRGGRTGIYRTGSYVSVPVPLGEGRYGVINVADPVNREVFQPPDLELLQDLALLVAHALSDAQGQQSLERRIIQAREDERRRVAQELHDETSHTLTAAIFRLDLDALHLADDPASARRAIELARAALVESAALLHGVAYALRPRILADLGLLPALRSLVAVAEEGGLLVTLEIDGVPPPMDEATDLAVFRVVQEALTNVRKHARATRAWVRLRFHARGLAVTVEDDGIGFAGAPAKSGGEAGLGLRGMRERVVVLGGDLAVDVRPQGGTRVIALFPIASAHD